MEKGGRKQIHSVYKLLCKLPARGQEWHVLGWHYNACTQHWNNCRQITHGSQMSCLDACTDCQDTCRWHMHSTEKFADESLMNCGWVVLMHTQTTETIADGMRQSTCSSYKKAYQIVYFRFWNWWGSIREGGPLRPLQLRQRTPPKGRGRVKKLLPRVTPHASFQI